MHDTLIAGYFNFELKSDLTAHFGDEATVLLQHLSTFRVRRGYVTDTRPVPGEIDVIYNLLQRGLPTMASLSVEKALTSLGFTREKMNPHEFSFELIRPEDESFLSEVFCALHVIDPHFSPSYKGVLESSFEHNVFENGTIDFPFLRQLLVPQVPLDEILVNSSGFKDQRTDFILPLLYPLKVSDTGERDINGYIIEVDGKPYHSSFKQIKLDNSRDSAASSEGWNTKRISENSQVTPGFDEIARQKYVSRIKEHFFHKYDPEWLRVLQFTLVPFAVARIQKVIIDAIVNGLLDMREEKWEIIVVERDVPCAQLAIDELNHLFSNIFALSGQHQVPELILKRIFCSKEFSHSEIRSVNEKLSEGDYDGTSCDLLIDISVLRRYGMEPELHYQYPYVIARSERWPAGNRQFRTSEPLVYSEIDSEEGRNALKWFLQNIFRKKNFRQGQLEILSRALQLKTVIGLLPTGGGKSLTYQLAVMLQPGFALVVAPLRSLMKDQVDNLIKIGIDTCALSNSTLTRSERLFAQHQLASGQTMFFFVSPERLMMQEFRMLLKSMNSHYGFSYCVIDEVHCVSEWGHDFRPAYLALGKNAVKHLPFVLKDRELPLFGLTATASYDVLSDVERELLIDDDPDAIVSAEYTSRDELIFEVAETNVDYETYELKIDDTKKELFIVNPIVSNNRSFSFREKDRMFLRKSVAEAKIAKLTELLSQIPVLLDDLNSPDVIQKLLEATWDEILDSVTRSKHEKRTWVQAKWNEIKLASDYNFDDSGGLIFAPHRASFFGVSDKFKTQKDEKGNTKTDAGNKPVFIEANQRTGIADRLRFPGIRGAIPIDCKVSEAKNYVGTFIGSSDESPVIGKIVDEDSFRNQSLFIHNHLKLMVATKAFGMGIDKQNIRFTIHFNSPSSPESFVQEAGRAGRDGKLALSLILRDRGRVYSINQTHLKLMRKMGYAIPLIDNRLKGQYFKENDFRHLLQCLKVPSIEELRRWPQERNCDVPFDEINMDEDILQFFHDNSFKGADIEKWFLDSILFNPITFPASTNKSEWEKILEDVTGQKITLSFWEVRNRIYLRGDLNGPSLGYISVDNEYKSFECSPSALEIHDELRNIILSLNHNTYPNAAEFKIQFTLQSGYKERPGLLEYVGNVENQEPFLIGFGNYFNPEEHSSSLLNTLRKYFNAGITADEHTVRYSNALKSNLSFDDYLNTVFDDTTLIFDTPGYYVCKKIWYEHRTKSDTDKAIYRLSCLGLIDDFEVDYRNNLYYLYASRKSPGEYVTSLYVYLCRYYSESRVRRLLESSLMSVQLPGLNDSFGPGINLKPGKKLADLWSEMTFFITAFAHREIALKRKAAMRDIFEAYDEFLNNENEQKGTGNFKFKSNLHLYFNSKYAREGYKAVLDNDKADSSYSLRDETKNGKILNFERVLEYIGLMAIDTSGSETDNIKHLRGAATRLLRSDAENPGLLLLKAFSQFVLSWQFESSFRDACADCQKGFINYFFEEDTEIFDMIATYREAAERYLPGNDAQNVRTFFSELASTIILKRNLDWLRKFNHHFLKDFQNNKLTSNG